jgi:phage shock protein E
MQKPPRNISPLVAVALSLATLTGCASNSIDTSKYDSVIDVRSPLEYSQGHLKGAMNIDVEDPNFIANIEKLRKIGNYVLYCHSGRRAGLAIDEMKQDGFTGELVNAGGYSDASSATGLPIVTN